MMTKTDKTMEERLRLLAELKTNFLRRRQIERQLARLNGEEWRDWLDNAGSNRRKHPGWRSFDHPGTKPGYTIGTGYHVRRSATAGAWLVVIEDTAFYDDDFAVAEYDELGEAINCADSHANDELAAFVYDDKGRLVHAAKFREPREWIKEEN
jgi:hypothetical protein